MDSRFVRLLRTEFQLDFFGVHGINHWARVYYNGMEIAQFNKANRKVVKYFAFLHDIKREDEFTDPEHGLRASNFIDKIKDKFLTDLDNHEIGILKTACAIHNTNMTSNDITIQTCLDADRLDLARVGIMPDERYLQTAAAKTLIHESTQRAEDDFTPPIVNEIIAVLEL